MLTFGRLIAIIFLPFALYLMFDGRQRIVNPDLYWKKEQPQISAWSTAKPDYWDQALRRRGIMVTIMGLLLLGVALIFGIFG